MAATNQVDLYKVVKGKARVWSGWVDEDAFMSETGLVDGKKNRTSKTCTPKNVGKKNERTGETQALQELESAVQKKKAQELWCTSLQEACDAQSSGGLTLFRPMLANSFEIEKNTLNFNEIVIQPKLDGVRLNAYLDSNGEVVFQSRKGTINTEVSHLSDGVKQLLLQCSHNNGKVVLDGEVYRHDLAFESIVGSAKKSKGIKLEYHVYDVYDAEHPEATFVDRFISRFSDTSSGFGDHIKIVKTFTVANNEELLQKHQEVVTAGFEGLMIRISNAPYEVDNRSKSLLKMKAFHDDEFMIVGYTSGTGRDVNSVIFECALNKNNKTKTFKARPSWPLVKRQQVYNECVSNFSKYEKK